MNLHVPHPWKGFRPWKRHSLVLLVAGFVYIATGVTFLLSDPTYDRREALHFALELMPIQGWGVVFILAGLLAIISSKWPPVSETWGYSVLTGLSAGWSAFYLTGIMFSTAPNGNLTGVLAWGLLAFMWWAISGLVNPPDRVEEEAWTPPTSPPYSSQP